MAHDPIEHERAVRDPGALQRTHVTRDADATVVGRQPGGDVAVEVLGALEAADHEPGRDLGAHRGAGVKRGLVVMGRLPACRRIRRPRCPPPA